MDSTQAVTDSGTNKERKEIFVFVAAGNFRTKEAAKELAKKIGADTDAGPVERQAYRDLPGVVFFCEVSEGDV